jgi:alpha-L-fucosidase 2
MNRLARAAVFFLGFSTAVSLRADPGPMSIWFTTPGTPGNDTSWQQEALPVGNGKLAAMIYGGIGSEQIQFNEDTIWGGQPHNYSNPNSTPAHLAALQAECFNFTSDSAFLNDATTYLMSVPIREAAYQNPGALVLNFPQSSGTSNYLRSLDLNSATVNVHYDYNGVTYNRDVFASAPSNRVIVLHFTASQSAKVTFSCSFTTPQTATYSTSGNDLVMHASVSAIADSRYYSGASPALTNAVKYDARVRLIATGGTVSTTSSSISVTNADDVVLLLAVVSNVKNYNDLTADYATICSNNVAAAAALGLTALRLAQTNDYQNLFNRVVMDLGGNSRTNMSIGYRKKQIAIDGNDPQLVALDFQLGRYLMISGSRPGSQPLNLQGKWNDSTAPSWDSKMTLNINEEMNYWGAEICNLSECTLPLFDMIQDLSVTGNKIAQSNYFSSGWVAHHNTDLWRGAAPINGNDGIWPTGGAWLCQHVWWHYLYTGDTNWLATNGYPLIKGAAQFFQGFLVTNRYPKYANWPATYTNWMVTCPSYSPEHDLSNNTAQVASPTMDNELLRDLFSHVIAASQILNTDATFSVSISNLMSQLPPDQVGSLGQLQEWLQDYDDSGHRHCSQLVGFFPGDEISTYYTPATAAAAKRSVDLRGYANSSLTPWSCAWRLNLRDRLQDGDGAWTNLMFLYGYNKVATNLVFADIPNRQLDCAFGRLSGIAGMFLQSPRGEVILLPALPSKLTNGMVSGLCARGGFEVDNMSWTNGRLAGATILSKAGNVCNLRSKWPVDVMLGSNYVDAPMVLPGLYQFSTIAGSNYTIIPANVFETENLSATTSGATQQIITNAAFSNWRGAQFNATAAGNSVSYVVSNLTAGNYHIRIYANAGTNCARFQLACAPVGGVLTNVGSVQDTYAATNMAYLLPLKLTTPTNVISLWTNMVTEFDCGDWQAISNGNYTFNFSVVDKNAASSGYNLVFDFIKLTPVVASPPSPIEQWRAAEFGAETNNPAISGNDADPDDDGAPNLLEYALGRNPLVADATNLTVIGTNSNYLTLVYHRAKIATDVTFIVEVKDDLNGVWTTNVQTPVVTDDGNGLTDKVSVEDSVPMNSTPHRFMRLRVTQP